MFYLSRLVRGSGQWFEFLESPFFSFRDAERKAEEFFGSLRWQKVGLGRWEAPSHKISWEMVRIERKNT